MKELAITALLATSLVSCHAGMNFYPVQGPLAVQTPSPVFVGKVSGGISAGALVVTAGQGEVFTGRWKMVKAPSQRKGTASLPVISALDNEMAPAWDSLYGNGFYVAQVLGARLYARASLTGTSGSVMKVEFYRPEGNHDGDVNAIRGSVKGVAKDDKGNVYKVTIS